MSLPSENQLNRALRIGKQAHEPLSIMQEKIGALVSGKAACEAERQHIFFKDAAGIRRSATFRGELTRVALAHLTDQRFSSCCTHLP